MVGSVINSPQTRVCHLWRMDESPTTDVDAPRRKWTRKQPELCKKCGEPGHRAKTCGRSKPERDPDSRELRCRNCGQVGHNRMTCTNERDAAYIPEHLKSKHTGKTACSRCGSRDHNVARCEQTEVTRADRLCTICGKVKTTEAHNAGEIGPCRSCFVRERARKPRPCAVCGNEFMPKDTGRKVCSEPCRRVAISRANIGTHDKLTGQTFGEWTVLSHEKAERCFCRCACGHADSVIAQALRDGKSTACRSCTRMHRAALVTDEQRQLSRVARMATANAIAREKYAALSPDARRRQATVKRAQRSATRLTDAQKQKYKEKRAFSVLRAKELVLALKAKPCMDCGQLFHHVCMDFDHRTGETKTAGVAELVKRGAPHDVILAEVAKCDLVCSTCHRLRTYNRHQGIEPAYGPTNPLPDV